MSINKNIFINYGSQILNSFLGLVLSIYVARVLGPEIRGDYTIYNNSIILLGTWLSLSLSSSIVYFINSQIVDRVEVINSILIFTLFTSIFAYLILEIAINFNLGWIVLPINFQTLNWILIFAIHFLFSQLIVLTNGILNAGNIFIPQSIFNTVMTLITALVWMCIYFSKTEVGFGFGAATTFLLTIPPLLYNFYLIHIHTKTAFSFKIVNFYQLKKLLKYSTFIYVCNALQMLTYRMDLWFMKYYHGSSETGIYSLSVNMAQLIWILPGSISAVLYSELSKKNDLASKIEIVNKYSKLALYTSLSLSIGLFITYFYLGPILYGQKFVDSTIYLGILLFGIVPFSLTTVIATFNAASNNVFYNFWTTFWGFLVAIVFCLLLIPKYGAIGASFATVFSYNACNIYILYIYKHKMNVNLTSFIITKREILNVVFQIKNLFNAKP